VTTEPTTEAAETGPTIAIASGTVTPATYAVNANVLEVAIENAVNAASLFSINERTAGIRTPSGQVQTIDLRAGLDPLPDYTVHDTSFASVESLGEYVNRYSGENTLGYVRDLTGQGIKAITSETPAAVTFVIDDHPIDGPGRRAHRAHLTLRPTVAARRWGAVLAGQIDQEKLLDLVVDGIGEIAAPPAAELRDLVSDLHAVRNTSAKSLIRTGGGASLEVAETVTLHAGPGNRVTLPERIDVTFAPFTASDQLIVLAVKVKPIIGKDDRISFELTAPELDTQIRIVSTTIRDELAADTNVLPLWIP